MTDPIRTLLERVKELDEKATDAPWFANNRGIGYEVGRGPITGEGDWPEVINDGIRETFERADAYLIAECRSYAPQLARALEAVLEVLPEGDHTNPYTSDLDAGRLLLAEDVRVVLTEHLGGET